MYSTLPTNSTGDPDSPVVQRAVTAKNALISSRAMLHLVDSRYMVEVNLRSIVLLDPLQNGHRVIFLGCR